MSTRLSMEALELSFGVFTWRIPLKDISRIRPDDDLPLFMKYGGAGIHFLYVRGRYRASFNFLEHSRVVIELKRKTEPVSDVSFSTRRPGEIIRLVNQVTVTF